MGAGDAPTDLRPVGLLVQENRLFAVSYRNDGRSDDRISQQLPAAGAVNVERWDDSSNTWEPVRGTDGVLRSGEVSAAAGPAGLVVLANSMQGEPLLWTLMGDEMVPADDPTLDRLPFADSEDLDTDTGLAGLVRSIDLQATTEGFVAQLYLGGGETVMLRSDDGREWTEVGDAPANELLELAAHAGVVVANTLGGEEVWRSNDDGRTWDLDTSLTGETVLEITAGAQGWALWTTQDPGWSPVEAVVYSPDSRRWASIRDLSADDVDWVTGLAVTDSAVVLITAHSPDGGFVCSDVEATSYRAHVATPIAS